VKSEISPVNPSSHAAAAASRPRRGGDHGRDGTGTEAQRGPPRSAQSLRMVALGVPVAIVVCFGYADGRLGRLLNEFAE